MGVPMSGVDGCSMDGVPVSGVDGCSMDGCSSVWCGWVFHGWCSSVWCGWVFHGWVFQCLVWMGVPVSGALISAHSPNTRKYCPLDAEGPSFLLGWAWQRDVRKMEATLLPISLDGLSCIHKTMYQLCNQ